MNPWTTSDLCCVCHCPALHHHDGRLDLPCCGRGKCESEIEDRLEQERLAEEVCG